jgi:hypothetical protein
VTGAGEPEPAAELGPEPGSAEGKAAPAEAKVVETVNPGQPAVAAAKVLLA